MELTKGSYFGSGVRTNALSPAPASSAGCSPPHGAPGARREQSCCFSDPEEQAGDKDIHATMPLLGFVLERGLQNQPPADDQVRSTASWATLTNVAMSVTRVTPGPPPVRRWPPRLPPGSATTAVGGAAGWRWPPDRWPPGTGSRSARTWCASSSAPRIPWTV